MNSILTYSDDSDQELYFQTEVQLGKISVKLRAATIAGSHDKLNEDTFAVSFEDEVLFVGIFDGTTSFPIPALGKVSSARYASHFIKEHFKMITEDMSPQEAILAINKHLWKKVQHLEGVTLFDTLTLPASTATMIKIDLGKHVASFAHIGDAFGIAYFNEGHSIKFTDDKNERFDEEMFKFIREIAKEKSLTNREARQDKRVDQALGQMYYRRNNNTDGKGSGLINGDPHLELYIQTGEFDLQKVRTILIGTDGLLPQGWSEQKEKDRKQLLTEIQDGGFQKLFKTKKQSEAADPQWHHIRYKDSDDATGILIEL